MKELMLGCWFFIPLALFSQNGQVQGKVTDRNGSPVLASITILGSTYGGATDGNGEYRTSIPTGVHILRCSAIGFQPQERQIEVTSQETFTIDFRLQEDVMDLEQVVVTGTRTEKRRTDSPVIVNLISSKTLDKVVATNLSEGLRFQPGLRVETDCQTCNYTQLRMNGLQGGYSQILINGRPIFSPLTGLYGLEQLPVNLIERIEVVRGGVSALYGSSAIGGTVNVITKIPVKNSYGMSYTHQFIGGGTNDAILLGNATVVNEKGNAGATFFVNHRERDAYDANGDLFSELPQLKNNSFGINFFQLPRENQKLEASISSIDEYRYGGELVDGPPHLAQQSEERTHNILMGSLDYQINFNEDKSSLILYYGGQRTDRDHYTGILPDGGQELTDFLATPPYGSSAVSTHQGGVQFNHRPARFLGGRTVWTAGAEYVYDAVLDVIPAYNYTIDQTTRNAGAYFQNDWDLLPNLNFLSGFRLDRHNLVDHVIFSPRLSLLYKWTPETQLRLGWGTGFRAPQAFDTDLHIAFAGGGVSRVSLADGLQEERSNSLTASLNFDRAREHFIAGFTLEGFYTHLNDAFFLFPLGTDDFGERFEKRNGSGAIVKGITVEARANFDYVLQLDGGLTLQSSEYGQPVETIAGLQPKRAFLRTPNTYGYATLSYTPTKNWSLNANLVHTGTMELAHFGGPNTGQAEDTYQKSDPFTELSLRLGHTVTLETLNTDLEFFGGVKNITDSYQDDFDLGKNRDSNYVYGPSAPRTIFIGIRLTSN
ncbi:MAG: TonB-dependent receptor [Sediminicola sp.]